MRVAFICTSHITEFPTTAIDNVGKLQLNFIGSVTPVELSSIAGRTVIRKCCDRNEVYSQNSQCTENQGFATDYFDNLQSARSDEIFFRIGLPNCSPQYTNKFQLTPNGNLAIDMSNSRSDLSDQLLSIEHYCIEDMVYYDAGGFPVTSNDAFFCSDPDNPDQHVSELTLTEYPGYTDTQDNPDQHVSELIVTEYPGYTDTLYETDYNDSVKIRTPKCCPSGYVMDEWNTCRLLKLGEDSSGEWIISQALNNYFFSKHNIVSNLIPNNFSESCESIRSSLIDEISAKAKFEADPKNELSLSFHFHIKNYWDFKIKPKPFCVDLVQFRSEKEVFYLPKIFYCTSQFHVSIHYPVLLCISAAGLITTLIIYFFVPTSGNHSFMHITINKTKKMD